MSTELIIRSFKELAQVNDELEGVNRIKGPLSLTDRALLAARMKRHLKDLRETLGIHESGSEPAKPKIGLVKGFLGY